MLLKDVEIGQTVKVKSVKTTEKLAKFLFSLGLFEGEKVTLISKVSGTYIVNVKDSRYSIDEKMASSIEIE